MSRPIPIFLAAVAVCACGQGSTSSVSAALTNAAAAATASADGGADCAPGRPSEEDIAACDGKAAGDACTDIYDGGDPGTCQLAADGVTLACQEQHAGTPRHH
jgi:hypothetical protein